MSEADTYRTDVLVSTTWGCNLKCSYCFVRENDLTGTEDQMSPDLAARVVDILDDHLSRVKYIGLHLYGGEPLTNLPAAEAMVKRAAEKEPGRFKFSITTNGSIVTQETIDLMKAGNFGIVLSTDGPSEIHDECRRAKDGSPTHASVMKFLDAVRSRTECSIRASAVVRPGWRLADATEYLRALPVDAIKAQMVKAPKNSGFALSETEMQDYLSDLEDIGRHVITELEAGRMPKDDRFSSKVLQLLTGRSREYFCGAGLTTFGITPNGDILPCVLLNPDGCLLGNIKDNNDEWVGNGNRWRVSRESRPACGDCRYLHLCGGGCPAMVSICGDDECTAYNKSCEIAVEIYEHFKSDPETLLILAGVK